MTNPFGESHHEEDFKEIASAQETTQGGGPAEEVRSKASQKRVEATY